MSFKNLIVVSLAVLLYGCSHDDAPSTDYTITISATDIFDQQSSTYTQGEIIQLNLTITNTGDNDISFLTGDGCLADYEIFNSNNASIGNVPRICLAVIPIDTPLKNGDTLSESVSWNQDTNLSVTTQLPIGTYSITGNVFGHEKSASITIAII